MLRILLQTFLGIILLVAGGYLGIIFLQGLSDSSGTWAILCAVPMLLSGIILLFRAGKSDATVINKVKIPKIGETQNEGSPSGFEAKLAQDNQMIKQWDNTNELRTQLKVMQATPDPTKEQ